jgi:hypothetical protein
MPTSRTNGFSPPRRCSEGPDPRCWKRDWIPGSPAGRLGDKPRDLALYHGAHGGDGQRGSSKARQTCMPRRGPHHNAPAASNLFLKPAKASMWSGISSASRQKSPRLEVTSSAPSRQQTAAISPSRSAAPGFFRVLPASRRRESAVAAGVKARSPLARSRPREDAECAQLARTGPRSARRFAAPVSIGNRRSAPPASRSRGAA